MWPNTHFQSQPGLYGQHSLSERAAALQVHNLAISCALQSRGFQPGQKVPRAVFSEVRVLVGGTKQRGNAAAGSTGAGGTDQRPGRAASSGPRNVPPQRTRQTRAVLGTTRQPPPGYIVRARPAGAPGSDLQRPDRARVIAARSPTPRPPPSTPSKRTTLTQRGHCAGLEEQAVPAATRLQQDARSTSRVQPRQQPQPFAERHGRSQPTEPPTCANAAAGASLAPPDPGASPPGPARPGPALPPSSGLPPAAGRRQSPDPSWSWPLARPGGSPRSRGRSPEGADGRPHLGAGKGQGGWKAPGSGGLGPDRPPGVPRPVAAAAPRDSSHSSARRRWPCAPGAPRPFMGSRARAAGAALSAPQYPPAPP